MRVEFGWFLDRAPWAYRTPELNSVRVGRLGLTALLQTRLGTTHPETPHIVRINQYLERIRSIDSDSAWFNKSFEVDPWSTAEDLLRCRDDLVANGWNGALPKGDVSELVRSLCELEQVGFPLAPALADDVASLVADLDTPMPLGISHVQLQHPSSTLPAVWRTILSKMAARGVHISEPYSGSNPAPEITVLEAETEWEAAENAARWLAASSPGRSTAAVASRSTAVLDQYLARQRLPRLGIGDKSRWRGQDQIIPLFLEVIWGPVNVRLLGEFLSLPLSPVRAKAAGMLQKALTAEPGTGGAAWQEALQNIAEDSELGSLVAADLDWLFNTGLLLDENDLSGADLRERCEWLAQRLKSLAPFHETLQVTAEQLKTILGLVSGLPRLSRRDLRRIVASVVSESSNPLVEAEASSLLRLNHLNELMDDVDDVLWWGFEAASPSPGRRWDEGDRQALASIGVDLPSPEDLAALTVAQTLRAARRCKSLVIVQTAQQDGERVDRNPLLEALIADQPADTRLDGTPVPIAARANARTATPESLYDGAMWRLANRQSQLVPVQERKTEIPPSSFELGPRADLAPERLSFTQLSKLIGCSLAWVLDKKVRLRVSKADDVPTGNRMIGTFVHKVVEELHHDLAQVRQAVPTEAQMNAKIDELLPRMASELLLPGQQSRLKHLRTVVRESVLKFFATLSKAGIVIQAMEQDFEKPLAVDVDGESVDIPVGGKADVVGIDADGRRVVVDLKWSNKDKYRLDEVRDGEAVQLALYQWALNDENPSSDAPTAYYLLKQGAFASADAAFGNPLVAAQSSEQLWERTVRAVSFTVSEVVNGRVAAGPRRDSELAAAGEPAGELLAETEGRLYGKPLCKFCNFATLCGLKGDFS